jgi:hypothetical protein
MTAFENGADGKPQAILPGAEPAANDYLRRRLAAPLQGSVAQNLVMDEGLFGDQHHQLDLVDEARKVVRGG